MTPTRAFALVAALLLAGCAAQRPILYPPDQLAEDPVTRSQQVHVCEELADANVRPTLPAEALRETFLGSAIGAASGVVGGAIFGAPGTGAAVGAASGATAGLLTSLFRAPAPSGAYQAYVSTCLADRGYQVVGWQ